MLTEHWQCPDCSREFTVAVGVRDVCRCKIPRQVDGIEEPNLECVHRGLAIGKAGCSSCSGTTRVKLFACGVEGIGQCTLRKKAEGIACCERCEKITPPKD